MKKIFPILIGIKGLKLTNEEKDFLTKNTPFGIVIFKRNIQTKAQLKDLISEIKNVTNNKTLTFIDQEGGLVDRLASGGIVEKGVFKPAFYFYEISQEKGLGFAKDEVFKQFDHIGRELKEIGIDGDFAPVADLFHPDADKVIGSRSFGPDVRVTIELCIAAIDGLHNNGIKACLKHVPGHGRARGDSHFTTPTVENSLAELQETDFKVFRQLTSRVKSKADFLMTAHVTYLCLDEKYPATTSKKVIDFIRSDIGFNGQIITDCINMKGLQGDVFEKAKQSFNAGCDIILYTIPDLENIGEIIAFLEER